jgi:hypothetical protein
MTALILQFNTNLRRAACPLAGPRLAGALVGVGMAYWLLPITVWCAAVDGYREAQRDVLRILP